MHIVLKTGLNDFSRAEAVNTSFFEWTSSRQDGREGADASTKQWDKRRRAKPKRTIEGRNKKAKKYKRVSRHNHLFCQNQCSDQRRLQKRSEKWSYLHSKSFTNDFQIEAHVIAQTLLNSNWDLLLIAILYYTQLEFKLESNQINPTVHPAKYFLGLPWQPWNRNCSEGSIKVRNERVTINFIFNIMQQLGFVKWVLRARNRFEILYFPPKISATQYRL